MSLCLLAQDSDNAPANVHQRPAQCLASALVRAALHMLLEALWCSISQGQQPQLQRMAEAATLFSNSTPTAALLSCTAKATVAAAIRAAAAGAQNCLNSTSPRMCAVSLYMAGAHQHLARSGSQVPLHAGMRGDIHSEWDEVKQHDVLFLLTIRPPNTAALAKMQAAGQTIRPDQAYGLAYVRGCEVIEVRPASLEQEGA